MNITEIHINGYEKVLRGTDPASQYHGIIAVHDSTLGPAVGGTRLWSYPNEDAALTDALRLARGMTYKSSLAGLPFGGGKSVILRPAGEFDREQLFRAHGRLVDSLAGKYITAEDVGSGTADMEFIRQETNHVAGLAGRSGDPSPLTARGVFRAMQACAQHRWKNDSLEGKRIALQGCGNVGEHLARSLSEAGARLTVADIDEQRALRVSKGSTARHVRPVELLASEFDIFAPCALGGIINDETVPRIAQKIVCGAANNQLLESRHGDGLARQGTLYAPDYAANAGGIVNGAIELAGWTREYTLAHIEKIYDTILNIFRIAESEKIATYRAADQLAERRLRAVAVASH